MNGYDFLKRIKDDEKNIENSDVAEESSDKNSQQDKIQWKELKSKDVKGRNENYENAGQDSSKQNEKEEELEKSEELETENNSEQEEVSTSRLRLPRHHGHHDDKSSDHRSSHVEL